MQKSKTKISKRREKGDRKIRGRGRMVKELRERKCRTWNAFDSHINTV
jgi:hypothetical protein